MAQPALQTWKRRGLAVAVADASLTSASNAIQSLNGSCGTERDKVERDIDRPFFGGKPSTPKNKRGYVEADFEFQPPTAPGHATNGVAPIAPVLLPCAMAQTLTALSRLTRYNPVSSSLGLCDLKFWHSGTLTSLTDARGNLSGIKMEVGERFMGRGRLTGTYSTITQETLPTDFNYSAFTVPTVCEYDNSEMVLSSLGTAAIDELHLRGRMLSVDMGNDVKRVQYTEHAETRISDRLPTFSARFAQPDFAEFNPTSLADSGELITLYMMTRETDGRYTKLAIRGQIESVTETEIDGDHGYEISGPCIPSDSGGDEFYIEYGDETFALNGTLPGGTDDVVYVSTGYTASGVYVAPLTWTVQSGALPTGLTIASGTGIVSGTPTTAGTYTGTIRATDSTGGTPLTADKSFSIVIGA